MHFSRLFWSSQNRRCLTFEQAPGPRLALGTPGPAERIYIMIVFGFKFCIIHRLKASSNFDTTDFDTTDYITRIMPPMNLV